MRRGDLRRFGLGRNDGHGIRIELRLETAIFAFVGLAHVRLPFPLNLIVAVVNRDFKRVVGWQIGNRHAIERRASTRYRACAKVLELILRLVRLGFQNECRKFRLEICLDLHRLAGFEIDDLFQFFIAVFFDDDRMLALRHILDFEASVALDLFAIDRDLCRIDIG